MESPNAPGVAPLLAAHVALMRRDAPPESVHSLDAEALDDPNVTFWTAREGGRAVGCAALRTIGAGRGEIKSMHVLEAHRGRGIAALLLEGIVAAARERGFERLNLETGSAASYRPARTLYARYGFTERGPFGDYAPDPHSVFMERIL